MAPKFGDNDLSSSLKAKKTAEKCSLCEKSGLGKETISRKRRRGDDIITGSSSRPPLPRISSALPGFEKSAPSSSLWSEDFDFTKFVDEKISLPEDTTQIKNIGYVGLCCFFEVQSLRNAKIARVMEQDYVEMQTELESFRKSSTGFNAKLQAEKKSLESEKGRLKKKIDRLELEAKDSEEKIEQLGRELEEKIRESKAKITEAEKEANQYCSEALEQHVLGLRRHLLKFSSCILS